MYADAAADRLRNRFVGNSQHPVTNTYMRLDIFGIGWVSFNLFAKGGHKYPQRLGIAFQYRTPDFPQDKIVCENFADIFGKQAQQFVFHGC